MKARQKIMFSYNQCPCGAFTIITAHLWSPHTFSGHLPLGFCIVDYYLQLLLIGLLCLPAQRATSTWKFTFLLPPQGILQPMPNWYKEIKTHLPCLDEFWINSGVIHIPKFLCSIWPRLVFILKSLSSLASSLSLSLFLHSFTGSLGSTSLITHWIINHSLRMYLLPTCPKTPTNQPHLGKVPVGHWKVVWSR